MQFLEFWNLLLTKEAGNSQEDLTKLNDFGSKINQDLAEIYYNFKKMQKIKRADQEALKLYSNFLANVMNDKAESSIYKSKLNEIERYQEDFEENLLVNLDNISD